MYPADRLRAELHAFEGLILFEDLGIPGKALAKMRQRLHREGLQLRAVPTSQLRRALADGPLAALQAACTGKLLLVVVHEDPAAAARYAREVLRGYDHLRLRACAAHGAPVELEAMTKLPSRVAVQRSLVELLQSRPSALLELLDQRVIQLGGGDPRCSATELEALRHRLASHLQGPRVQDDERGQWFVCSLDVDAIFAEVPTLRLRSGWRLRGYAYRTGGDGQGFVVALPPGLPDPHPLGAMPGSLFEPPLVAGRRPAFEALTGDGSDASYLHASILLRELAEFGALWHGTSWGDHHLVEAVPSDWPWTSERWLPRSLAPKVVHRGADVRVELVSFCTIELVRLVRHVDVYAAGTYQARVTQEILATAGFGAVH